MKKWRNIRDTYLKTLKKPKSGSGCNNGRQYLYAKQLSFLKKSNIIAETESSLDSVQLEGGEDREELVVRGTEREFNQNNDTANDCNTRQGNSARGNKRKRDVESSLIAFMNTPIPSTTTSSQMNPHQSFFDILVPILNCFTEEETVVFRIEVLTIVRRMQKLKAQQTPNQTRQSDEQFSGHAPSTHTGPPMNNVYSSFPSNYSGREPPTPLVNHVQLPRTEVQRRSFPSNMYSDSYAVYGYYHTTQQLFSPIERSIDCDSPQTPVTRRESNTQICNRPSPSVRMNEGNANAPSTDPPIHPQLLNTDHPSREQTSHPSARTTSPSTTHSEYGDSEEQYLHPH
jgi:hypothetical protein